MNITHINKTNAFKILDWCIHTFGKSRYKFDYPHLELVGGYCKVGSESYPNIFGEYDWEENEIYIYKKPHLSFIAFVNTIIHEYTHYLQSYRKYNLYATKYRKGLDLNHPYEIAADRVAGKYQRVCLHEVFGHSRKFYYI